MSIMLARAVGRSLLTPATNSITYGSFRITSSAQWTRSLANNHRRGNNKKPIEYSRSYGAPQAPRPSSVGPQRSTGVSDLSGSQKLPAMISSRPGGQIGGSDGSKPQGIRASSSPDGDKAPKPDRDGSGTTMSQSHAGRKENYNPQEQVGSNTSTSPSAKSTNQESEASSFDSTQYSEGNRPLPDLTRGIPSTLDYETEGSTSSSRPAGPALNLTEDPTQGPGTGGRGRGELPASAYISSSEKKRLRVANYMYASFAGLLVLGYIYLGRNWESKEEEARHADAPSGWAMGLMWNRVKARTGDQLNYYNEPAFKKLLPDVDPSFERPYTLVLSLEDLLIHSEWSREHGWRMAKRPGVDYFLRYLSQYYEIVIFTSVPWAIGEPVIKKLDPYHINTWALYREATLYKNGEYVKDLSYLNRDLSKVILIDTVSAHAEEQPENAIILPKWKGSRDDQELISLIPFLEYIPTMAYSDVRKALKSFEGTHIPSEFAKREAIARKKFQQQMAEEQKKRPKSGLGFLSNALGVKPMPMMEGEQSPAEAFAQGKMLQDQARERGQKNYEALEKLIREEGEKWLKEEAAQEEMAKQEGMKAMKSGFTGFFGVPGSKPESG